MPIIKSSKTDKAQTVANNVYTKTVKNAMKNTEKAIAAGDVEKARELYSDFVKAVDKATSKGLIKKNNCAREKSRLNAKIKGMNN